MEKNSQNISEEMQHELDQGEVYLSEIKNLIAKNETIRHSFKMMEVQPEFLAQHPEVKLIVEDEIFRAVEGGDALSSRPSLKKAGRMFRHYA